MSINKTIFTALACFVFVVGTEKVGHQPLSGLITAGRVAGNTHNSVQPPALSGDSSPTAEFIQSYQPGYLVPPPALLLSPPG